MKILWTMPYVPWPTIGGNRLRAFSFLHRLAARGHRVTLLIQSSGLPDDAARKQLELLVERLIVVQRRRRRHPLTLLSAAFAPYPIDVSTNGFSRRLRQVMRDLLDETWDVVQVEHSYGLQSFLSLLEQRGQPFVLTEHNVESTLVPINDYHPRIPLWLLPPLRLIDQRRYRRWERRALTAPTRLIAVTTQDADRMSAIARRPVDVIANGADVLAFAKVHASTRLANIMFIGNYAYPPNADAVQWAATEIMPRVWQRVPDARLIVCGNAMHEAWPRRWPDPRIDWKGFVADVTEIQRECAVFLAPLRAGGGSKLKVLEAMAAGLAVVSTPEGVSGLSVRKGEEFVIGRDAEELSARLIDLFADPSEIELIGEAGRRYVASNHDWSALTDQLETIYRSLPIPNRSRVGDQQGIH